jgi:hypothetical protein
VIAFGFEWLLITLGLFAGNDAVRALTLGPDAHLAVAKHRRG